MAQADWGSGNVRGSAGAGMGVGQQSPLAGATIGGSAGGKAPAQITGGVGYEIGVGGGGLAAASSSGSVGSTAAPATGNAGDWEAYITNYGFPPDVVAELRRIFQNTPDVQSAQAQALAYIRGTPWYEQTFPGIKDAIKMGIISDERDYRNNMNTFNQVYRQYTGRDLTAQEYAAALREGITAETAARRFQGAANVAAYGNDWQYLAGAFGQGRLSEADLKAQGEQQAGISTPRGTFLDKALQQAEQRMRRAFEGVLATPGFSQSATGRILSPGLSGGNIGDIGR